MSDSQLVIWSTYSHVSKGTELLVIIETLGFALQRLGTVDLFTTMTNKLRKNIKHSFYIWRTSSDNNNVHNNNKDNNNNTKNNYNNNNKCCILTNKILWQ